MKKYLAIFRAGTSSLHPSAIERLDQQKFDYALSWFADEPPLGAEEAVFVDFQKGSKWVGLEQTLIKHWDVVKQYDFVWLPDDDLLCNPEDISRMFLIADELNLDLAQPALTLDSYFSHVITLQHSAYQVRFTNFVEIMAPVLSKKFLERVRPTLSGAISGWGLDFVWPRMTQLGKVGIIDAACVKHTRPVGGPNYKFSKEAGLTPVQEMWINKATNFIDAASDCHLNYGGLLSSGDAICLAGNEGALNNLLGTLISSTSSMSISPVQLTKYLTHHYNYWSSAGVAGESYPRDIIAPILNAAQKRSGMRFA